MTRLYRSFAKYALALVLTALPVFAQSNELIRLTDRDDLFGWEAVGRVELRGNGYCTGVLIAPDLVLTAAHCVFDSAGKPVPPDHIHFRAGLRDGIAIAERQASQVAASKAYQPGVGISASNVRNDAALIRLSSPILSSVAAPFVIHSNAQAGDQVSVVSYGRGRDDALSWQRDCSVLQRGQGLFFLDCNVTFGSSGAPVFYRDGRRARILSLISGGRFEGGKSVVAYGMELPAIVDQLKRDLRALPSKPSSGAKFQSVGQNRGTSSSGAKFYSVGGS
jgi:protease YdgD